MSTKKMLRNQMAAYRLINVFAGILALFSGGLIYVIYRKGTLIYDLFGLLMKDAETWRENACPLSHFIIYNLPGGLWSLAYILIANGLTHGMGIKQRLLLASIVPAIGCVSELLQLLHILPGMPDMADALCYMLPYLVSTLILTINDSSQ